MPIMKKSLLSDKHLTQEQQKYVTEAYEKGLIADYRGVPTDKDGKRILQASLNSRSFARIGVPFVEKTINKFEEYLNDKSMLKFDIRNPKHVKFLKDLEITIKLLSDRDSFYMSQIIPHFSQHRLATSYMFKFFKPYEQFQSSYTP
jgi:hypothetical protein